MPGDWAWEEAVSYPIILTNQLDNCLIILWDNAAKDPWTRGATLLSIILGSDKTT